MTALPNSVFTHDPSLMTDHGAIILSMGKALRRPEPALHEAAYRRHGHPDPRPHRRRRARSRAATASGSTPNTLAIGRGVRTNQAGIQQMAALLGPHRRRGAGLRPAAVDGEEACLHLMSVISPLADDLALVYSPLLPAAFYQLLKARGIRLVEGDAGSSTRATASASTCCRPRPREVIAVAGFPKTAAAMEAAGCAVQTFEADALCIACEGGPTCLTRPVLRAMIATSRPWARSAKR